MDRVKGIDLEKAEPAAKAVFHAAQKILGKVPRSKLVTGYDTQTLLATSQLDGVTATAKTVAPNLKELVQLKAAVMVGCPF
jgi:hypothetical protein